MSPDPVPLLKAVLLAVAVFILLLLAATVYRRIVHGRRYRKLDRLRAFYARELPRAFHAGGISESLPLFAARPGSLKWQAIEDVLFDLSADNLLEKQILDLFLDLGYVSLYEKRLKARNVITRAAAAAKLGRMRSVSSAEKLVELLDEDNPEIITVAVRSLSRIGTPDALRAILGRMPILLSRGLISRKALESSLRIFGRSGVPILLEHAEQDADPLSETSILEVLAVLGAREALPIALASLHHPNPEMRSKALKLAGAAGDAVEERDKDRVTDLLNDPVWFVRLHAAKALGALGHGKAADRLGDRLCDENWQVRNGAAMALTRFGNKALPIFLGTLEYKDRYAKESICEEIEKTGFIDLLIENMDSGGEAHPRSREMSKEILRTMKSLDYCTPLREYLQHGTNERIKRELAFILSGEPSR
jgi:HEAT repeat protein